MIRSVFVDANMLVDWLNADSEKNEECTLLLEIACTLYGKPLVSPISLAIVYYLIGKKVRHKQRINSLLNEAFKQFRIAATTEKTVRDTFASAFLDLEDGLQYQDALESDADAILTYNLKDYTYSQLPVLHPQEFIQLHQIK